jgi:LacI family transcriptional regulator
MTMRDLAALAGLDISTVSRAVRGDTTRVAPTTIARVQALAEKHGYRPDPLASSLRSGRSRVIGVLVPTLMDTVVAAMVEGIAAAADGQGYMATVTPTGGTKTRRSTAMASFLARRVDGVILADATARHPVPGELEDAGLPYLMALRPVGSHPFVAGDDYFGGQLAGEHLLSLGHEDMVVIAGPRQAVTSARRLAGFKAALAGGGVKLTADRITHTEFSLSHGRDAATALLDSGLHPTAMFVLDDYTAMGAVKALNNHRLTPGRDVAIIGYNDAPISAELQVPLTTVHSEFVEIGRLAVETLINGLEGKPIESQLVTPHLVVRESSCRPRRSRRQ